MKIPASKTEPLLSIKDVSVGYGKNVVVRDVSFDVSASELCALLGLNGSGKTTLLKGICGLLPLTSGHVRCEDIDLIGLSEKKRAQYVSLVPQRHSKLIGVTVLDAVLMGQNARLGLFESTGESGKALAMQALEKMGAAHLTSEDFSRLSEGQKQLVILARTLIQDTPVVLMDEPDASLDFPNKHMMLPLVRDMVHSEKKACIVTLHDPHLAVSYCDKLILMDKGNVVSTLNLGGARNDDIESCLSTVYGKLSNYLDISTTSDMPRFFC